MDNHEFYINSQIKHFQQWGSVEFSNDDCLPEYENALRRANLAYKIVRALGDYGITISLCTPAKYPDVVRRLDYEITRLEKILALKKSAQQTLAPDAVPAENTAQ